MKLFIKFLVSHRVTAVANHDHYEVEKLADKEGPTSTTCSADHIKPWRGFRDDLEVDDILEDGEDDESELNYLFVIVINELFLYKIYFVSDKLRFLLPTRVGQGRGERRLAANICV